MVIGNDILRAAKLLKQEEVVAIPTETVYGLAANAFNIRAVAKIYEIKNRPQFNPLIVHTDSLEKLCTWGLEATAQMKELMKAFSPGPIAYVIPKSELIPDMVTAGTDAVAVRIPNHPTTLKLLSLLDFPLAAPSANPSGFVSPTTAQHVAEQLGKKLPYILDGGICSVGIESTIVSFLNQTPEILRHGGIAVEDIETVIGKVIDKASESEGILTDNPVAPGMLAKHYATKHKLIRGNINKLLHNYHLDRIAVISFRDAYRAIAPEHQFILSPSGDLTEAASRLFAAMRRADQLDIDFILTEFFPNEGLGKAINDRLKRASV